MGLIGRGEALQMPMLLVIIIGMLIVPMPPVVLDVMLVFNIGLTLMVLLRVTGTVTLAKSVVRRFGKARSFSRSSATRGLRLALWRSQMPSTKRR